MIRVTGEKRVSILRDRMTSRSGKKTQHLFSDPDSREDLGYCGTFGYDKSLLVELAH